MSVPMLETCGWSATRLAAAIRSGTVSSAEALEGSLGRIELSNPAINAIVTLDPERAMAAARRADRAVSAGQAVGPLHGLPMAVKDLQDTAGLRTTYGSTLHADRVPTSDSPLVAALRHAGAIVIGKTNTPEFGAGSQTSNELFGPTRNPFDLDLTAGGSSGGAAAAVASEMTPLADGTDLGGSVRNPAAFCGIYGLRPSVDLAPGISSGMAEGLSVVGPLARTSGDLHLFLDAISGRGRPDDPDARSLRGLRVAWSADGGGLPIDSAVGDVLDSCRLELERCGSVVRSCTLDLGQADYAFETLRADGYAKRVGALLDGSASEIKATLVAEVERGRALSAGDLRRARLQRAQCARGMADLLMDHDVLALPATQVEPFSVDRQWPELIDGHRQASYLDWMRVCSRITVTGHPAAVVPAGRGHRGPVGLQLVGRRLDERSLVDVARAFEREIAGPFAAPTPDSGSYEAARVSARPD